MDENNKLFMSWASMERYLIYNQKNYNELNIIKQMMDDILQVEYLVAKFDAGDIELCTFSEDEKKEMISRLMDFKEYVKRFINYYMMELSSHRKEIYKSIPDWPFRDGDEYDKWFVRTSNEKDLKSL